MKIHSLLVYYSRRMVFWVLTNNAIRVIMRQDAHGGMLTCASSFWWIGLVGNPRGFVVSGVSFFVFRAWGVVSFEII